MSENQTKARIGVDIGGTFTDVVLERGFGNPYTREPERVQEDFKDGLISAESATKHYGVVFHEDGQVDEEDTLKMRKNRT